MKQIGLAAAVALVALAGGCAAWTVRSEATAGTEQLGRYRTYAWVVPPGAKDDPLLDQRVRDTVTAQLANRGIVPAAAGQTPDFLIDYRHNEGVLRQTIVDTPWIVYPGASGGTYVPPLPVASTYTYQSQALIVDFMDARSGRVFWRGYAAYASDRPAEATTAKTQQAVGKIMRRYPVAAVARPAG
jgi:uncharacterized protein DUF4136